jgi:hypothetical protein
MQANPDSDFLMCGGTAEAECLLGVANAKKDVCYAQKVLADCLIKEAIMRTRLYRLSAAMASKSLTHAHFDVGQARISLGRAHKEAKADACLVPRHTPARTSPRSVTCKSTHLDLEFV